MTKVQLRRDTAANWTAANPVLSAGEAGVETDTLKVKVGNGSTAWASLAYIAGSGGGGAVASVNGHVGTVVLAASDVGADASGAATSAQSAAISAAATDATSKANAAQAAAIQRANHTGTQAATTITGLATVATTGAYTDLSGKPTIPATAADVGAVPTTRTVNGKALSANVTLAASDVGAIPTGGAVTSVNGATGAVTVTAGVRRRGYAIPYGSLANWDAARAASATTHADVLCSGDSTTEGILFTGGVGAGWVPKVRALAIADGVTDGGRGQLDGVNENATMSGESFAGYVSRTGWAYAGTNNPPGPSTMSSNTAGDVLTLQYKTPSNAVRVRCSANGSTGRLTVAVNGTTVGTIDPYVFGQTYGEKVAAFTGLTAGGTGQTVTITNTGGAPIITPSAFRTASNATTGGALAPGTYTWAITAVDGSGGETLMSNAQTATVPAGTSTNVLTTAIDVTQGGVTKWNLYRASGTTSTRTAFFFVKQVTSSGGGGQVILNDAGETPTGANPPATSTAGLSDPVNGGPKIASIAVDFYDSTKGVTFHRAGYSGQKYGVLYGSSGSTTATCGYDMQTHLGLTPGLPSGSVAFDWAQVKDPSAAARTVKLAICAFGINDLNNTTSGTVTADLQAVVEGVTTFILAARSAGADPLVVIPHLTYAGSSTTMPYVGLFKQAILNTADAHGVAWCDLNEALGPPSPASVTTNGFVHLNQVGYDTEATYLWTNILSATAPR